MFWTTSERHDVVLSIIICARRVRAPKCVYVVALAPDEMLRECIGVERFARRREHV